MIKEIVVSHKCSFVTNGHLSVAILVYILFQTKKHPPVGGRWEGVKNEKVLVRVVCWYT